tara:strand:+ start:677 stop:1213 length:537 start_codon:yes stop_codon:yes gene_type:complete
MWKEQLQINKPTIGSDIIDVPEEENDDCRRRLRKIVEIITQEGRIHTSVALNESGISDVEFFKHEISEEGACEVLKNVGYNLMGIPVPPSYSTPKKIGIYVNGKAGKPFIQAMSFRITHSKIKYDWGNAKTMVVSFTLIEKNAAKLYEMYKEIINLTPNQKLPFNTLFKDTRIEGVLD